MNEKTCRRNFLPPSSLPAFISFIHSVSKRQVSRNPTGWAARGRRVRLSSGLVLGEVCLVHFISAPPPLSQSPIQARQPHRARRPNPACVCAGQTLARQRLRLRPPLRPLPPGAHGPQAAPSWAGKKPQQDGVEGLLQRLVNGSFSPMFSVSQQNSTYSDLC